MINERIRYIRNSLKITQFSFAEKLGITRNTLHQYEAGRNLPTNIFIKLMCKEFLINEEWLRTGKGEIYISDDYISLEDYSIKYELTNVEKKLLIAFMHLSKETRASFISYLKEVFD